MWNLRTAEVRDLLAGSNLEGVPILPVSAVTGAGMDALKAALGDLRRGAAEQASSQYFRFSVDRVFSIRGTGTVVTGSVVSGSVQVEDRIILSPAGREARVRGIHAQNVRSKNAMAGDRAALNLSGVSVDEVRRGDVLLSSALHLPTQRIDASVRLPTIEKRQGRSWLPVHVHTGTGAWPGSMLALQSEPEQGAGTTLVQIRLDRPAAVLAGDKIVLRDASARHTLGGGTILDRRPPERHRSKPERLQVLNLISRLGPVEALPALLEVSPYSLDLPTFARDFGLDVFAFASVISRENILILPAANGAFAFASPIVLQFGRHIRDRLEVHHRQQPDQPGLSIERLRMALPERLASDAFAAMIDHMVRRGDIASSGTWLRLPDHVPRLSSEHEILWNAIKPLMSGEERFKPPRVNELSDILKRREETIRGLLKRIAWRGDAEEVSEDQFLLRTTMVELAAAAAETSAASQDQWFRAATFRDRLEIGRKMAILILECFDRHGLTIRKGDLRRVDPGKVKSYAKLP